MGMKQHFAVSKVIWVRLFHSETDCLAKTSAQVREQSSLLPLEQSQKLHTIAQSQGRGEKGLDQDWSAGWRNKKHVTVST